MDHQHCNIHIPNRHNIYNRTVGNCLFLLTNLLLSRQTCIHNGQKKRGMDNERRKKNPKIIQTFIGRERNLSKSNLQLKTAKMFRRQIGEMY